MDFTLPEEAGLVAESARQLGRSLRAVMREAEQGPPPKEPFRTYAELGFGRLEWPPELDGAGLPPIYRLLVAAELAGGCAGTALALQGTDLAGAVLVAIGAEPARAAASSLPAVPRARGRYHVYVDAEERLDLEAQRLRGIVPYLPDDDPAGVLILQRRRVAWVTAGLAATPVLPQALHAAGACALALDGPSAWTVELDGAAYARAMTALRLPAAAMLLGIAEASYAYAREYALEREVFGRPIAHHQAAAFWIAELRIALDAADVLLRHAAWAAAEGEGGDPGPAALAANQAYVEAVEAALPATVDGVQLLGGHGYVTDHPVEKWMREARTLSLLWGGADLARADLEMVELDAWAEALA